MSSVELARLVKLLCETYTSQYQEAMSKKDSVKVEFICGVLKGIQKLYNAICQEIEKGEEINKIEGNVLDIEYEPEEIKYEADMFIKKLADYCNSHKCTRDCRCGQGEDWMDDWADYMAKHVDMFDTEMQNKDEAYYSDLQEED